MLEAVSFIKTIPSYLHLENIEDSSMRFLYSVVVLIGFSFLGWALRRMLFKLKSRLNNSNNSGAYFGWQALLKALTNPIMFLCLFIGAILAVDIALSIQSPFKEYIPLSYKVLGIIFFAWVCLADITLYEKKYVKYKGKDKTIGGFNQRTTDILLKILKVLICIIAILLIMDSAGVRMAGILTVAGIGGASIAFASKDLLTNFISTITLYVDKPFSLGHKIKLQDGTEGYVEHIGWRMTRLRTDDKTSLYIANSSFLNGSIENLSHLTHKRINQTIGIRYADLDKFKDIATDIEKLLRKHSDIDRKENIRVVLSDLTPSAIQLKVTACTTTTNKDEFLKIQQEIILRCLKIIARRGAKPAFPMYIIEIKKGQLDRSP
jgi:MscS family membrane protein